MIVTFSRTFPGKRAATPATDDTPIDVRAYAGMLWNPRPELSFVVDGVALAPRLTVPHVAGAAPSLVPGAASDYLPGTITLADLKRLGAAQRVSGDALGFQFVLTDVQRAAVQAFAVRAASSDPAAG